MPVGSTTVIEEKSYDNVVDIRSKIPNFHPNHYPGNYVPVSQQTRTTFTKPIDFLIFFFFFTIDVINSTVCHTNAYVWKNIINKQ